MGVMPYLSYYYLLWVMQDLYHQSAIHVRVDVQKFKAWASGPQKPCLWRVNRTQ